MVGISTLRAYDFTSLDDFFNYIIESKLNGNFDQTRNLIDKLSKDQRIMFFQYMTGQQQLQVNDYNTFTYLVIKLLSA